MAVSAYDLTGRTAFVTGAASGIGRATAVLLAEAGATVHCADLDASGLHETATLIKDTGGLYDRDPARHTGARRARCGAVLEGGRGRAPASDRRSMRQGSLVPAALGCWGRDGCRRGLERHDRLHCLPKATPCSSTRRYAVSGAKGTPVTVQG